MRKLLKKVLTLSLCACMMIGMATGASAADIQEKIIYKDDFDTIKTYSGDKAVIIDRIKNPTSPRYIVDHSLENYGSDSAYGGAVSLNFIDNFHNSSAFSGKVSGSSQSYWTGHAPSNATKIEHTDTIKFGGLTSISAGSGWSVNLGISSISKTMSV